MTQRTILIVEDDHNLMDTLSYNLNKEGYQVVSTVDGGHALDAAREHRPDVIILDIMLPTLSGLEVCRILRKEMTVPILMLTAKSEELDKVVGLEVGADDYLTKPFSMRELIARVRAMLRRTEMTAPSPPEESSLMVLDTLKVDVDRHQATIADTILDLTPKEFDLLAFLVRNRGLVFTREQLLERVWGYDYAGNTRTVDVHIRWLRKKIETDPASPERIVTIRGIGYKLEC
jgi:two-component system OmpR family response regulator